MFEFYPIMDKSLKTISGSKRDYNTLTLVTAGVTSKLPKLLSIGEQTCSDMTINQTLI